MLPVHVIQNNNYNDSIIWNLPTNTYHVHCFMNVRNYDVIVI